MRTISLAYIATGVLLAWSGAAGAAQWYATPSASLRAGYNSNLELTTRPHNGVEELDLIPEVQFGRKTATSGITGRARFDARRYWGQSGLNTNDRLLDLHWYNNGQRMTWSLDGNITRDTTLQSELNNTGLVLQRTPRLSRSLSPGWSYLLSQKTQLNIGYQYQDVRYPDQAVLRYQDYRINGGSIGITHQYSQRLQLTASGSVTSYRTIKNVLPFHGKIDARYEIAQAGAIYAFSQTLSGSVSVGLRRSNTTVTEQRFLGYAFTPGGLVAVFAPPADVSQTSQGSVLNASLVKQLETGKLQASVSREIHPTGYGGLIETDRLGLKADRRLSARFSESLDMALFQTRAVSSAVSNLDRTFFRVEPSIAWHMTRWWTLRGSYRYARQRYKSQSETASQNVLYVTIAYTWPTIAVSR